ncbi:MAG: UDP-N-acetylmuramoyl-tripeptide--D-alanyl-D-alanine ligase [Candidatus Omnitrophica bacterium]|nr:UDP-N-acetylmuramoyl-tripeptide--D-alanyl-D-alanine ligase [Candidatus Omnitrophota bacterium]
MFKISDLIKATLGQLTSGDAGQGVSGISIDSRTIKPGEAYIAIKGNNFDGHSFIEEVIRKSASCIISELPANQTIRGSGVAFIQVIDTTKALGDIARFKREKFKGVVIALTGSNGKTTTKEMIAWVLENKFKVLKNPGTKNNHIGVPFALLDLDDSYDVAVLEIGTNHHGEVAYLGNIVQPDIACLINIGPSHLEFFKNLEGVYKEKSVLLEYLRKPGMAILNADDPLLKKRLATARALEIIVGVSLKGRADFRASKIRNSCEGLEFCVNRSQKAFNLGTLGYLNIYNALIAIACARVLGMEYNDIAARLKQFSFPKDRLQLASLNNVLFINDTYNANPVSLHHALDVLDKYPVKGRKILVMGDMMELGLQKDFFHCQAGERAAEVCDCFISVGKSTRMAAEAARSCGLSEKNIFICEDSVQAREVLFKMIAPTRDDIVLVKGSRSMRMEEVLKT